MNGMDHTSFWETDEECEAERVATQKKNAAIDEEIYANRRRAILMSDKQAEIRMLERTALGLHRLLSTLKTEADIATVYESIGFVQEKLNALRAVEV